MAHGRDLLRKAGEALRGMDEKYSQKIVDMYMGPKDKPRSFDNPAVGAAAGMASIFGGGTPIRYANPLDDDQIVMHNVAATTSALAKYAAPMAGAGIALKGAVDMANVLTQQTSGTLEPN